MFDPGADRSRAFPPDDVPATSDRAFDPRARQRPRVRLECGRSLRCADAGRRATRRADSHRSSLRDAALRREGVWRRHECVQQPGGKQGFHVHVRAARRRLGAVRPPRAAHDRPRLRRRLLPALRERAFAQSRDSPARRRLFRQGDPLRRSLLSAHAAAAQFRDRRAVAAPRALGSRGRQREALHQDCRRACQRLPPGDLCGRRALQRRQPAGDAQPHHDDALVRRAIHRDPADHVRAARRDRPRSLRVVSAARRRLGEDSARRRIQAAGAHLRVGSHRIPEVLAAQPVARGLHGCRGGHVAQLHHPRRHPYHRERRPRSHLLVRARAAVLRHRWLSVWPSGARSSGRSTPSPVCSASATATGICSSRAQRPPTSIASTSMRAWSGSIGYRIGQGMRAGFGAVYRERHTNSRRFVDYQGFRVITSIDYQF